MNIRNYATINALICPSNMENLNAVFIEQGNAAAPRDIRETIVADSLSYIHIFLEHGCGVDGMTVAKRRGNRYFRFLTSSMASLPDRCSMSRRMTSM